MKSIDIKNAAKEAHILHERIIEELPRGRSVMINSRGEIVQKQRPDHHSFSIGTHMKAAAAVMENILEIKKGDTIVDLLVGPSERGYVRRITVAKGRNKEMKLKNEVLRFARFNSRNFGVFNEDTNRLLVFAARYHDIGKMFEDLKEMENTNGGLGIKTFSLKRRDNGKPIKFENPIAHEINYFMAQIGIEQEAGTLTFYHMLYKKNVLSEKEYLFLSELHKAFTILSTARYEKKNTPEHLLEMIGDFPMYIHATYLLIADELGKGIDFLKSGEGYDEAVEKAEKQRISKSAFLFQLLEHAFDVWSE